MLYCIYLQTDTFLRERPEKIHSPEQMKMWKRAKKIEEGKKSTENLNIDPLRATTFSLFFFFLSAAIHEHISFNYLFVRRWSVENKAIYWNF